MREAGSYYKAARLFLTEERSGIVRVRLAVKPVDAPWNVMHAISIVSYDDYETPLPDLGEVMRVMSRAAGDLPLPQ